MIRLIIKNDDLVKRYTYSPFSLPSQKPSSRPKSPSICLPQNAVNSMLKPAPHWSTARERPVAYKQSLKRYKWSKIKMRWRYSQSKEVAKSSAQP